MITDEPFIDFKCASCGEMNSYPPDAAGLVRECVHCGESLLVPADGSRTGRAVPLPIQTERLLIRKYVRDDWKSLVGGMFDQEAEAVAWVERNARVRLSDLHEAVYLAVEKTATNRVVGYVGLWHSDDTFREMSVTFSFHEPVDFSELATETVAGLLKFGFENLGLHRITARVLDSESEHVEHLTRAGMRREGEFVKNIFRDGEWRSTMWFAMLEEEYFNGEPALAAPS